MAGCAQALQHNLADLKEQNSSLRKDMAAKEAELAVVRAELEALRRMQAHPAFTDADGQTDTHPERPQVNTHSLCYILSPSQSSTTVSTTALSFP